MIIGGKDLQELAREIFPDDVGNKIKVGNSSIDICFGEKFKTMQNQYINMRHLDKVQYKNHTFVNGKTTIEPDKLYLFESCVPIELPDDIVAEVYMRSTPARIGINHALAGLCDAGFKGYIVFEIMSFCLVDVFQENPLLQLKFTKQSSPAAYKGRYQNQASGVQTAKDF